jgi:hypothetical protein
VPLLASSRVSQLECVAFESRRAGERRPNSPSKQSVILSEAAKPRSRRICGLLSAVFTLAAAAALLLLFPPTQYGFYPQCPIHYYFGILCPGCGTTRALATLLRGHLIEALRLNALTTLSLPFALGWFLFARKSLPQPSPATLYAAFALIAAFTLVRNL